MRAVLQDRYGGPEVLRVGEITRPEPGSGEVLVRVGAASIHPDIWHVLTGRPWVMRLFGRPALRRPRNPVPGIDLAGEVVGRGKGAARFAVGDRVFGETVAGFQWQNGGAFAEYATAPESALVRMPENIGMEEAATVPTSGLIALQGIRDELRVAAGQRVLVTGAGGGVGSFAVQIARAYGASEVTGVDVPAKHELLRDLGCDRVIDHTSENPASPADRYDAVLDVVGSLSLAELRHVIAPGGTYALTGHDHFGARGRRLLGGIGPVARLAVVSPFVSELKILRMPHDSKQERLDVLASLIADGALRAPLGGSYPLEAVGDALRQLIAGKVRGKIVLRPDSAPPHSVA